MHLAPVLIHPVEGPACFRGEMGDMITVVGKGSAGLQYRAFANNFIPFDHGGGAVLIDQNPFPSQQGNGGFGEVVDGHKINKGMKVGTLHRRLFLVVDEFVEFGLEPTDFLAVFLHDILQIKIAGVAQMTTSFPNPKRVVHNWRKNVARIATPCSKFLMSKFALLSVSDKSGIVPFARSLVDDHQFTLLSTGGTARLLREEGIQVMDVSEHTGFPEMMDGRVKTLHPKVHGGLLCLRDNDHHRKAAEEHGIGMIDLVVVNLYPFEETVARAGVTFEEAIEQIDIGGPSMLRSAAKNHRDVTVVCDPSDYDRVLESFQSPGRVLPCDANWPRKYLPAPPLMTVPSVSTWRNNPAIFQIWMRFPVFLPKWRYSPRRR